MLYSAILLAGGKGIRTGKNLPKQFLNIAGKPMIVHSLERLNKLESIGEIIVSCLNGFEDKILDYAKKYDIKKKVVIVNGGTTRQESVYNALEVASYPSVIIHEAARPFVKLKEFKEIIDYPKPNVTFGRPVSFTVLKGINHVEAIIDRNSIFNVQLPQKFDTSTLKTAYKVAIETKRKYTEDAGLLFDCLGLSTDIIQGSKYNIKITDEVDLLLADVLYREHVLEGKFNE